MDQKWFEMPEIRRRRVDGTVWVPLRSNRETIEGGQYGDLGYVSEFYGVGTLAVARSLENLLAIQVGTDRARSVMGPLFGIYELRLADAHLPTSELDEALEKVGVDKATPYVVQGYQLLYACVGTIYALIKIVEGWKGGEPFWQ